MSLEQIYIHTYGRWREPFATFEQLTPGLRKITTLVVQHREAVRYAAYFGKCGVWVLPKGLKGLSATRQHIIEKTPFQYICMLDDDITNIAYRRDPGKIRLYAATPAEINELFQWCGRQLVKFAHCGISSRNNNHTHPDNFSITGGRLNSMLCYDVEVLRRHDFRFDRVRCMQDFDMTLQLLRAGYVNPISFKGSMDVRSVPTKSSREHKGGCDDYRTPAMQTASAKKLAKLHPEFVKLREKLMTGTFAGTRITDVTVQWRKAYESSKHN